MSSVPCILIDAFSDRPFAGNPAAVCLLEAAADAAWMQRVAAEMNLSETAFVHPLDNGFGLRWFTPRVEIDLCGHATLASAHALWSEGLLDPEVVIPFHTNSGVLRCSRDGDWIALDFPATPVTEAEPAPALGAALGVDAVFCGRTKFDEFVVVDSEEELRALKPNFEALGRLSARGVIVTAPSLDERFEFVSRFFAPGAGVDEDPVTGSAHCSLALYWSGRLGKSTMTGFQASARGGVVRVRVAGDRVVLGGKAVTVLRGALSRAASSGAG